MFQGVRVAGSSENRFLKGRFFPLRIGFFLRLLYKRGEFDIIKTKTLTRKADLPCHHTLRARLRATTRGSHATVSGCSSTGGFIRCPPASSGYRATNVFPKRNTIRICDTSIPIFTIRANGRRRRRRRG